MNIERRRLSARLVGIRRRNAEYLASWRQVAGRWQHVISMRGDPNIITRHHHSGSGEGSVGGIRSGYVAVLLVGHSEYTVMQKHTASHSQTIQE